MKLEDQVCSLELSKRLKELGVPQKSLFYWTDVAGYHELPELPQPEPMWIIVNPISGKDEMSEDAISAFTVAELGLPFSIQRQLGKGYVGAGEWVHLFLHQYPPFEGQDFYEVGYFAGGSVLSHSEKADTEANARAKMLIYLIENGLVKI
jgi:hypothetical protein